MNTIIVPVDHSPVSLNSVHYAANLAKDLGSSITLLNAYELPLTFSEIPVSTNTLQELGELSENRLSELKRSIEHVYSHGMKIYTESKMGYLVDELMELCGRLQPCAVVMGTTGHGLIHDLFVGGNTVDAMRSLEKPLIIVPPGCVYKKPMRVGLACDMVEVVENMPVDEISSLLGHFKPSFHIMNVNGVSGKGDNDKNYEALMAETLFSEFKPTFHFIESLSVSDKLEDFAESQNLDWIIVIPKKHRRFSEILMKSTSRELAYQSRIPLVCIHA